jgi:hypothetical protein
MVPLIPGPLKVPFTYPIERAPWGIAPITWLLPSIFISNVKSNFTSMVATVAISSFEVLLSTACLTAEPNALAMSRRHTNVGDRP